MEDAPVEQESNPEALQPVTPGLIDLLIQSRVEFRRFLARRLPSEAAADDLLQQSFLKAFEKRDSLRGDESVVAWFYQILRNTLIDHYRSHASHAKQHEQFVHELAVIHDYSSPAADELRLEVCSCVERLLPSLRPAYVEILKRVDLEGTPQASVAEALGLSLGNLKVRLHRAREALRESLERTCGVCTEHGCLNCTCQ